MVDREKIEEDIIIENEICRKIVLTLYTAEEPMNLIQIMEKMRNDLKHLDPVTEIGCQLGRLEVKKLVERIEGGSNYYYKLTPYGRRLVSKYLKLMK